MMQYPYILDGDYSLVVVPQVQQLQDEIIEEIQAIQQK